MLKSILKKMLKVFGIDVKIFIEAIGSFSLKQALNECGRNKLVERLREIEPDISKQYSYATEINDYLELKLRLQHAFQCSLMLKALENFSPGRLVIVDIGDSAGTHMRYLSELVKDRFILDSISVNLDPIAIEKIKARGQKAILSRAEDLNFKDTQIDLFTSFEMVEHLHNPVLFFQRLSKKSQCNRLLITVPYLKNSRVGLHYVRNKTKKSISAEEVHIFELNPRDWILLIFHSGWRVVYEKTYYQYPRRWPLFSQLLARYWRLTDYEGFWGAILEKDTTFSDCYQDWKN